MEETTLITHDWKFHIDEVFSYSILNYIYPNSKLLRTRDEVKINNWKKDKNTIIFDLWKEYNLENKTFDHHFEDETLLNSKLANWTVLAYRKILSKKIINCRNIFNEELYLQLNNYYKDWQISTILKNNNLTISIEEYLRDYIFDDIKIIKNILWLKIIDNIVKTSFQNYLQYRKYSSLWLIWKHYWKIFIKKIIEQYSSKFDKNKKNNLLNIYNINIIFENIDIKVIKKIDGIDNWYISWSPIWISWLIDVYNNEDVYWIEQNLKFKEASKVLEDYLWNLIKKEIIKLKDVDQIKEEYILWNKYQIFSKYLSWMDFFITNQENDITDYIIYFTWEKYRIKAINIWHNKSKILLPKKWLTEKPKGCEFIHTDLFISEFDTLKNAINAIR